MFIQVLIRFKHAFNNNKIITKLITILLIIFIIVPGIYWYVNAEVNVNDHKFAIKIFLLILEVLLDITINSLLRYSYVKALDTFATDQFRIDAHLESENKGNELLNCKQHELMLEATRYTVLFTVVLIVNALKTVIRN